jgi:hypothetical protein
MPTLSLDTSPFRSPVWLAAVALGGIAWNTFGAFQLAGSVTATE